jgi:hypothetical protein
MNQEIASTGISADSGSEITELIFRLKCEDKRNLNNLKSFRLIFRVLIVLYTLFFITNPFVDFSWKERLSGGCFVVAFALMAFIFEGYTRQYRAVDYSAPLTEMLRKAISRYEIRNPRILWLMIPLIFIDAGVGFSISAEIQNHFKGLEMWMVHAGYWFIMCISAGFGYCIWLRRQKPLRDTAKKMLEELVK